MSEPRIDCSEPTSFFTSWRDAAKGTLRTSLLGKLASTHPELQAETALKAAAKQGDMQIEVDSAEDFSKSHRIIIHGRTKESFDILRIEGADTIFLAQCIRQDHERGARLQGIDKDALILENLELPWFGDVANDEVKNLARSTVTERSADPISLLMTSTLSTKSADCSFSWCVGPVLAKQKQLIFVNLLMPCTMFLLAYHNAECDGTETATYPTWLWLVWLPFAVFHLLLETIVISYIGIPYIEVYGRFDILGIQVSFAKWFAWSLLQSLLFITSGATNSFFAATSLFAYQECLSSQMQGLWQATVGQSRWSIVRLFSKLPMVYLILALWGVSTLQFVAYLLYALPRECAPKISYVVTSKGQFAYKNWRGITVLTGAAFLMLGEALGISVVQRMSPGCAIGKARQIVERVNQSRNHVINDVPGHLDCLYVKEMMKESTRAVQHLLSVQPVAVFRIVLVGVLRNVLQANIQTSQLAFQSALSLPTRPQAIASIGFSVASTLPTAVFALRYDKFHRQVHSEVSQWFKDLPEEMDSNETNYVRVQKLLTRSKIEMWGIRVFALVFLISVLFTVAKFVAVWVCPSSLWNVTSGCVHMPRDF